MSRESVDNDRELLSCKRSAIRGIISCSVSPFIHRLRVHSSESQDAFIP